MRASIAAIILGLLFAGCIASEGAPNADPNASADNEEPLKPGDIDANSETGVVQGNVVSEEAAPIIGALVALQETTFSTTTDSTGFFQFANVPPGDYVLLVGALGYDSAGRQVTVTRAEITRVSILLSSIDVTSEVFYEIIPFTGFFECALATEFWISSCTYPYTAVWGTINNTGFNPGLPPDVQKNEHRFNFTIRQNIGQLQTEIVWQPASAAATRMLLLILCGDYDYVWDECLDGIRYEDQHSEETLVEGTSPIKFTVHRDQFYRDDTKDTEYDLTKYPEVWIMNYVGLPWGDPQVAFQQRFDVWNTVFYNGEGPEDWTVLSDA